MKNWEKNVRKVVPYTPGEQPKQANIIKLNTNENPYPPAKGVYEAWKNFDIDKLRLYPDPSIGKLRDEIAKFYNVSSEEVFVGVGSDDVIAMCFMTFFNDDKPIIFPDITYSFYDVWANMLKIKYKQIPLDDNFEIQTEDYNIENGGIIFPNPNAPTGVLMPLEEVEKIIKNNQDVIVMIDEAYIDFGGESAIELTHKYDNVLVIQTFSKSRSMAGARIGYAIGDKKLIKYLNDVKYSFNSYTLNTMAIELGVKAIEDREYFEETRNKIIKTREWTKEKLKELGFIFNDSKSNFIFARHETKKAKEIFEALKEEGIIVRYFSNPERINNYIRITIGTDEEMKKLIKFLCKYLEKNQIVL
ncbi:histidinol-phosphate transaminase [Lachnobacterium bovis]|uniref:histidinol-phosphate transaminase n=1 Tax=Lachnobacterium bovis TaxID=140626 RepID=UPI0004906A94|nr:histidinol-phosphate transaminase [Lachnobacterium bovis]